ncbi:hypothetical protein AV521_13380 [Streptomyces sp. IMTB 2501]|uniref:XRE family transcriptional regulator n=1 Tax=Streptomyces sp. IMTB 2501 TaxID=1776340 RepID=UPI00096FCD26|nr:XRE family transcriptional regulator [Streptomyces sp. IMTB 2501]OLZ70976.1 hypothetical protein AV521_13380 [Streptomyces sp. IMTB 2501]
MPRWKDLPEDLDPQIKEFTSQVRRLVDRSGLSVAALADRTGYSKTSWERYLGGRLLAPKGAIVALAEVTGTNPVHLTTMWELAERAWSRAEMRHDRTMEAIRISQARAALGEFGAAEATGGPSGRTSADSSGRRGADSSGRGGADSSGRTGGGRTGGGASGRTGRTGIGAAMGIAGPAGVSPTIPPQPTAPDADAREGTGRAPGDRDGAGSGSGTSGANSWGLAGYQGPSRASARPGTGAGGAAASGGAAPVSGARPGASPDGPGRTPGTPNPYDGQAPVASPAGGTPSGGGTAARGSAGRQRVVMFVAGLVGVLVVIAAVFYVTNRGGARHENAAKPSPSATQASPPPGVKCAGSACDGKDAEAMGCSGDLVTTAKTAVIGTTTLEVRYSKACGAAWGRITGAGQGDKVQVSAGRVRQTGETSGVGDTIAYTPMVAVPDPAQAKACATLASGRTGCTK